MKTVISSEQLIETQKITLSLIDASGVIYDEEGVIPTAPTTIQKLQSLGPAILVTNNSYHAPKTISNRLKKMGVDMPISHIFSSGFGLSLDPDMRSYIDGKSVFLFGQPDSEAYVKLAGGHLVSQASQAEVVVLASTSGPQKNEAFRKEVMAEKIRRPELPILCCNPDTYIRGKRNTLFPVIGIEGLLLEKELNTQILWTGKPFKNYYLLLKQWLLDNHNVIPDENSYFFDDNINNVRAMQAHLGVKGCCISETGIYPHHTPDPLPDLQGIEPDFFVPCL